MLSSRRAGCLVPGARAEPPGVGFLACCFSRRHWAGEKAMVVLLFMIMCDLNLSMSHNLGLILMYNTLRDLRCFAFGRARAERGAAIGSA